MNNTIATKKVPELRFPEFEGINNSHFKDYSFTELFVFKTGKSIKQKEASPDYEIPCVRYGELYHMYNEVIHKVINGTYLDKKELTFSEGNEILLPSAGEDPLDIGSASALRVKNVAIGRTINILKPKNKNIYSEVFVSYYINQNLKKNIARLAKGVSISNVYNSDLKKLHIKLPSLPEQQKIADFLSQVDKKIDLLSQKEAALREYKKGVMQKLFSQEIRFKIKNAAGELVEPPDWEEKRLGDLLDYQQPTKFIVDSTEYDDSYNTPVITAGKTFLLGYTNEDCNVYKDWPVIIFDDFTLANHYVEFDFKVKSSAMKILRPAKKSVDIKYIYERMQLINFQKGDEHKRFWISEYSKLKIDVPCIEEQTKIANFLSRIDEKIDAVAERSRSHRQWKKGLLQKMFV